MQPPPFDPARFQRSLQTAVLGRFLVYRTVTETTMELARREANEGAPHGTIVLAEEQTAGRGRRGRSFHSPVGGNLYFTLLLRNPIERQRLLPLVTPIAVCDAIRDVGLAAAIKWPNDIWIGARKVSGMLIDAEIGAEGPVAFPGIGINVNADPTVQPELRDIATSMQRELDRPVVREELLARICNGFESLLALPEAELLERYRERSMILGQPVLVAPVAAEPYKGRAVDIAADGSLVVETDDGKSVTVTAADVSIRPE